MSYSNVVAALVAALGGIGVLQSGASHGCLTSSVLGACASNLLGDGQSKDTCLLQLPKTQMLKKTYSASLGQELATFWGYNFEVVEPLSLLQGASTDLTMTLQDLVQPSNLPYNLTYGTDRACFGQWGQDALLNPILSQISNGFFVESGAFDGEDGSNSLMYELKGWKGLLVEPGRANFAALQQKHRRAYAFNGALSPSKKTETLRFSSSAADAITQNEHLDGAGGSGFTVTAAPLADLLKPLNQHTVDFWSLDIEGSEGVVLENTDFDKIEVGVLLIEMNKSGENNDRINAVMKKEGFVHIGNSMYNEGQGWQALDHIFVNPKYFKARGLPVPSKVDYNSQRMC